MVGGGVGGVAGMDPSGGVGDLEGVVGQELRLPTGRVQQVMVPGTDEHEIVEGGGAAAGDPAEVVGFGPVGGPITASEAAVVVADDQGVVERGGDGAGGGAVVQDRGAAVGDHPVDTGVAQQPGQGGGVEGGAVDQPPVPVVLEVGEGGDDVEMGAVAAARARLLVVQVPAAQVDEGVGAAVGGAAGGFTGGVGGLGEAQGGGDDGAAFGVEAAR